MPEHEPIPHLALAQSKLWGARDYVQAAAEEIRPFDEPEFDEHRERLADLNAQLIRAADEMREHLRRILNSGVRP